jgi:hypothetical protein
MTAQRKSVDHVWQEVMQLQLADSSATAEHTDSTPLRHAESSIEGFEATVRLFRRILDL